MLKYSPARGWISLFCFFCLHYIVYGSKVEEVYGRPVYRNGPYIFIGCDSSQAYELIKLFTKIGEAIKQKVIPDARLGRSSRHGLENFFKTNNPSDIAAIFQKINDGEEQRTDNPKFVCANPTNHDPFIVNKYDICVETKFTAYSGHKTLPILVLCPRFWSQPLSLPGNDACPLLDIGRTTFERSLRTATFFRSQLAIIIHELAHAYLPKSALYAKEIYDLFECMAAPADVQFHNAENYAIYASFVVAGCRKMPKRPRDPDDGLRLRIRM